MQEIAVEYNDKVIYPDNVRLNLLLQALFLHQGHPDDLLHHALEENGVCWGGDIA